jgi:hypothetical protein
LEDTSLERREVVTEYFNKKSVDTFHRSREIKMVVRTKFTELFHPLGYEILKILKHRNLTVEEIKEELSNKGIKITKRVIAFHIMLLLQYNFLFLIFNFSRLKSV